MRTDNYRESIQESPVAYVVYRIICDEEASL